MSSKIKDLKKRLSDTYNELLVAKNEIQTLRWQVEESNEENIKTKDENRFLGNLVLKLSNKQEKESGIIDSPDLYNSNEKHTTNYSIFDNSNNISSSAQNIYPQDIERDETLELKILALNRLVHSLQIDKCDLIEKNNEYVDSLIKYQRENYYNEQKILHLESVISKFKLENRISTTRNIINRCCAQKDRQDLGQLSLDLESGVAELQSQLLKSNMECLTLKNNMTSALEKHKEILHSWKNDNKRLMDLQSQILR